MVLTVELVPKTSWKSNVRTNVSKAEWDIIRRKSYKSANYKCEICNDNGKNQGYNHPVECHEIWDYNDDEKSQTLIGFISLCPMCHKTKHAGKALVDDQMDMVIEHMISVNNSTEDDTVNYLHECFDLWNKRSEFEWKLDLTFIRKFLTN